MRNPADFAWRIIAITPLPARVVSTAKLVSYLLRSGRYFRSLWKLYEPRGAGPRPAKAPSARNWAGRGPAPRAHTVSLTSGGQSLVGDAFPATRYCFPCRCHGPEGGIRRIDVPSDRVRIDPIRAALKVH